MPISNQDMQASSSESLDNAKFTSTATTMSAEENPEDLRAILKFQNKYIK